MTPKINLLFLVYHFPNVGGVEQVTTLLANEFVNKYKVSILAVGASQIGCSLIDNRVVIDYFPQREMTQAEQIVWYNNYLIDNQVDIIVNQSSYDFRYEITFNLDRPPVKIISVMHACPMHEYKKATYIKGEQDRAKKSGWQRKLAQWKLSHGLTSVQRKVKKDVIAGHQALVRDSDILVLLAQGYIQDYQREYRIDKYNRVAVIGNPITARDTPDIPKKREILYVGRLSNFDKRVDRLLRIWSVVSLAHPDWRLRIMGDGPDREMLEAMSKDLNLSRIEFCGYGDPEPAYRSAAIVALTSQMECLPMSLIEAAQYGCVPIAFDCSAGVREILSFGVEDIQVTSYDELEYANKLAALMSNYELRGKLSRQARNWALRYDVETIVAQWHHLILDVLQEPTK